MRILLLCLLGLLSACAGPSQSNSQQSSRLTSSDPGAPRGAAHSLDTPDDAVLGSVAEQEAIAREQEMLKELADRGIFPMEDPTQVTVKYHRSGVTIGLYNEANVTQADYYTTTRNSASYKVVSNIKMGALLKALEDLGFYEEAYPDVKRAPGASLSVVVLSGTNKHTLSWGQSMGEKNNELTQNCADSVRVMFDTTMAVQVVENPDGTDFFQHERDRINNQNALKRAKQ